MNNLILSVCLLCISINQVLSQGLRSKEFNSIDFSIGYNASFRFLSLNGKQDDEQLLDDRILDESLGFNPEISLAYNIGLTKRTTFKTGIRIANPGMKSASLKGVYTNKQLNMATKFEDETIHAYRYNYLFVGVPFAMRYVFSNQLCKAYVELGASANYYINTKIRAEDRDGILISKTTLREDISRLHFTGKFSFGSEWVMSDQLSGFFQMNVAYQLNTIHKGIVNERLASMGFEMGIRTYLLD